MRGRIRYGADITIKIKSMKTIDKYKIIQIFGLPKLFKRWYSKTIYLYIPILTENSKKIHTGEKNNR